MEIGLLFRWCLKMYFPGSYQKKFKNKNRQQKLYYVCFCTFHRHKRVKLKCFGTWETQWHFCWGPQRKVVCSSSIGHIQVQSCIQKLTTKDSKSYVEKQIAIFLSLLLKIQKNSWKSYIEYSYNFYLNNINTSHIHL